MKKLSVITVLHPFGKSNDLKQETLYRALLASLARCDNLPYIELSVIDTGTYDQYGRDRHKTYNHLVTAWQCLSKLPNVIYNRVDCFTNGEWHMSKALHLAVEQSHNDYIFVVGIDIIVPQNLYQLYFDNVKEGKEVWVPRCYNLIRDQPWEIPAQPLQFNGWRTARGLMGMAKSDYFACGGYPTRKVGFRVGIDAHLLRQAEKRFKLNEFRCEGLFHEHHMDSNAVLKSRLERK